jgi:hypothetical protein
MSASPDSGRVLKVLAQAFGLSSPVLFAVRGHDGCSWRTCQASLFGTEEPQQELPEYAQNWPDSGMWDAGAAYELEMSEPATCESGSSLWPTVLNRDYKMTSAPIRKGTGKHRLDQLPVAAMLWISPQERQMARVKRGVERSLLARVGEFLTSRHGQQIQNGTACSGSDPILHRRLNPRFVEWLMGFPIGWTEP